MQAKKLITSILCCTLFSSVLTGCYDAREVDDEIYAVAIGIDKGVENKVRITIQYPTYKSGGSGGGIGAGEQNKQDSSNVHTIECPSIIEGLDMYGMAVSRKVSLMHVKMLVFSEDIARADISSFAAAMQRFREARSSAAMVVVKGTAENFLLENKSNIGGTISKAIEEMFLQARYSNYFPYVHFVDFYRNMVSPYQQPIAIYGGVNDFKQLKDKEVDKPPLVVGQGFKPGELPRRGVAKREFTGVAVFRGGKMVGSLDSYETTYYLMMMGQFNRGAVTVEDPNAEGKAIVLNVRNNRKPKIKTSIKDGKATVNIKLDLEADIQSIQSKVSYENPELLEDLNKKVAEVLHNGMKKMVKKTQKEFKSDIFGFGKYIAANFLTIQDFQNYNWLAQYPQSEVNIDVAFSIRRSGLILKSIPFPKTEKESNSGE